MLGRTMKPLALTVEPKPVGLERERAWSLSFACKQCQTPTHLAGKCWQCSRPRAQRAVPSLGQRAGRVAA